jgi:trehalose 6-phosphate phosphatase
LLFDVDGTLAPIAARPDQASVPAPTRNLLIGLSRRYAAVACVSGRRAEDARNIVGVEGLAYIGNHGLERLAPGADRPHILKEAQIQAETIRSFADTAFTTEMRDTGIRTEDKEAIWAFHWRGAPDEGSAREMLEKVAEHASQEGLVPHWGRMVLEIRPPIPTDKGTAVARELRETDLDAALYAGDDRTDLDAFRSLRELRSSGALEHSVCVGVTSEEGPAEIAIEADLVVEGPDGVRDLLARL